MRYQQAVDYLQSFVNYECLSNYRYEGSFKLRRMKSFLASVNNPHQGLSVIHVAGSKAKGSVCSFIGSILKEAGLKVGLYTSPHLNDFRERIRILSKGRGRNRYAGEFEGMIPRKQLCGLVEKMRPSIKHFNASSRYGPLTFFEVYTSIAFEYFRQQKVDIVVLETGLGGRFDATNTAQSLMCVITPVSHEHTYLLGKSLRKIAYEKASIIKKENRTTQEGKRIALTAAQRSSVRRVVGWLAHKNNALLFEEGRHFRYAIKKHCRFDYSGLAVVLKNLRPSLAGEHQIANASLAIAACEALRYHTIVIAPSAMRRGIASCRWPARFEVVRSRPAIVFDGAQNDASMQALRSAMRRRFPKKNYWVVFGISRDKEIARTCRVVSRMSKRIILTKSDNPRAMEPDRLARYFPRSELFISDSVAQAMEYALSQADKKDVIVVTGSLFVCAQAREMVRAEGFR